MSSIRLRYSFGGYLRSAASEKQSPSIVKAIFAVNSPKAKTVAIYINHTSETCPVLDTGAGIEKTRFMSL